MKTNYKIVPLSENERGRAVHFIEKNESECTALMEQIQQSAEDVFVLKEIDRDIFCALFFIRTKSTLMYFIPFTKSEEKKNYNHSEIIKMEKEITNFISKLSLFCVYGEESGGILINSILKKCKKNLIISKEYFLMTNDFSNELYKKELILDKQIFVKKCSFDDIESLIELERGYRLEEVLVTGIPESDALLRMLLEKALQKQIIFSALYSDSSNEVIAKVATNARGKNFYQIGGVFTKKEFRNKGIMFNLMIQFMKYIHSENKKATLFVNIHNEPAKKVYEKLGFILIGKYRISYFQK